jgi:hypothetical protein
MEATMDTEAVKRLRFDTRLRGRRGWTTEEEYQREIAGLPDVSDKIRPSESDARSPDESGSEPAVPGADEV